MPSRATKKGNTSTSPNKKTEKPEKADKGEKHEAETKSGHKRQREPSQDKIYFVEALLDKKKFYGVWRYKVKWQGFSEEECTWEPAKNLESVKDMIAEFNKTFVPPKEEEEEKAVPMVPTKEKAAKSKTTKAKEKEKEKEKENENENDKMKKFEKKTRMGSPQKKVKTDKLQDISKVEYSTGHFKLGDHAKQITNAKKESNQILFTVEWKAREDGKVPGHTKMTNEEIRKYDKDLLLDFYEARLKFVKPPAAKTSGLPLATKENPKEVMEEEHEHESKHSSPHDKGSDHDEEEGSEAHENVTSENQDQKDNIQEPEKSVTSEGSKPENQPGENVLGGKENVVEDVENEIDDHDQPIYADISFQVAEEMRVEAYDPSYVKSAGGAQKTSPDAPKQDLMLSSPQEMSDEDNEGEGDNNNANDA